MIYRLLLTLALLPVAACADADERADQAVEAPAATPDEPADLDVTAQSTLDAIDAAGGLTRLAPEAAIENINGWIVRLANAKEAPAGVVLGLETLKEQLAATPLDGEAVGGTLMDLGEQTAAAAGEDNALTELAQSLTAAGALLRGL